MSKLNNTLFYFEKFKTPYPDHFLYTFYKNENTGTFTPYLTYNSNKEPNKYPLLLDENGSADIYLDKGFEYKIVIRDMNNTIVFEDIFKTLEGKDGVDNDEPFNPTEEELEKFRGKDGIQGETTKGETTKGPTGLRGPDALSSIVLQSNNEITIPAGISEIFITACAGGGAGANYSNSSYFFDVKTEPTSNTAHNIYMNYKYNESDTTSKKSKNYVRPNTHSMCHVYFIPGSGFAGQSVYSHRIALDKDIENKVSAVIGHGGTISDNEVDLDGKSGGDTEIFVNGKSVLLLKGGLGGQNNSPIIKTPRGFEEYKSTTPRHIYYNLGYNSCAIMYKLDANKSGYSLLTNDYSNTIFSKTTVYEKSGPFWKEIDIWIQNSFSGAISGGLASNVKDDRFVPLNCDNNKNEGQRNIFSNVYIKYPERHIFSSKENYNCSVKTVNVNAKTGFGAGGDIAFDLNSTRIETYTGYYFRGVYVNSNNSIGSKFADKTELLNIQFKLMSEFETTDKVLYSKGIKTTINEQLHFSNIDNFIEEAMKDRQDEYIFYIKNGWYNIDGRSNDNRVYPKYVQKNYSGNGTEGFCFIEYGNIDQK